MDAAALYSRAFAGAPSAAFETAAGAAAGAARVKPAALDRESLIGAADQGFTRLIALAADFAAPPEEGWRVTYAGKRYAIENVDGLSRSAGGVTLAYVLDVRG